MLNNALNLEENKSGNRIKQGDKNNFSYKLIDSNNEVPPFYGSKAKVYLLGKEGIIYQKDSLVDENGAVNFVIDDILQPGIYTLEIHVRNNYDDYIFPSDSKTKIEITSSVNGDIIKKFYDNHDLFEKLFNYGIEQGYFTKNNETETPTIRNESPLQNLTGVFIGDSITEFNFRTSKKLSSIYRRTYRLECG